MNKKHSEIKNSIKKFISKAGRDAGVPIADTFLLEVSDTGELEIKGCHELLTCCEDVITINADEFRVIIKGEKLFLTTFTYGLTAISGIIISIEFVR